MTLLKAPVKLELLLQKEGKYDFVAITKHENIMNISLYYDGVWFDGYEVVIVTKTIPGFQKELFNCYKARNEYFIFDEINKNSDIRDVDLSVSFIRGKKINIRVADFKTSESEEENQIYVEIKDIIKTRDIVTLLKVIENFEIECISPTSINFNSIHVEAVKGSMFWYKLNCLKVMNLDLCHGSLIDHFKFCRKIETTPNLKYFLLQLRPKRKSNTEEKIVSLSFNVKLNGTSSWKRENILGLIFSGCEKTVVRIRQKHEKSETMFWLNALRRNRSVEKVQILSAPGLTLSKVVLWSEKFNLT